MSQSRQLAAIMFTDIVGYTALMGRIQPKRWTHLNENDACYYFKEVYRILKPGGKAVISFFYLDDLYENSLKIRTNGIGRYHIQIHLLERVKVTRFAL